MSAEKEPTDQDIILAMNTYGGGFTRILGQLALAADEVNLTKIKETWPNYWAHYQSYARCKLKGFPL